MQTNFIVIDFVAFHHQQGGRAICSTGIEFDSFPDRGQMTILLRSWDKQEVFLAAVKHNTELNKKPHFAPVFIVSLGDGVQRVTN